MYANPTMCLMLEVGSAADLQGQTHHRFFTPESLARMRAEHDKRSGGVASTYEVELVGLHGSRRNVVISGVPVTDDAGALTGLFGSFTDITERKRAETALSSSENRLRSLFAASVDAIGVSRSGTHVMVNPAYVQMFGATSARELEGTPILDLIAPGHRAEIANYVRLRTRGETTVTHYITRGLRRDGREFPLEVHVSSYEEQNAVHTVAILRDITDRLNLEEQLRQSQKMDALGRLAGGVAHDFNNLLTVVMSCADVALMSLPEGSKPADNIRLIRQTGERAATLTRQLLALSRRQVIDPKVIDLNVVVAEMAALLDRLLGTHIILTVDAGPSLSRVRVDAGQFQQVVMNLCVNARDAMPEGGQLTISTRNVYVDEHAARSLLDVRAGHYVVLSITDTGQGLSAEAQERLFEPFFTTKAPGQGTGLGLSMVYGIVKQSGGHVSAVSAVGEGTTFQVYVPAADVPDEAAAVTTEVAPVTSAGTVLLVEDEPALRQVLHRFLSRNGYRVLAAADGHAALALFMGESGAVDLVVTDMVMNGMSGAELVRELDAIAPGLRVLFMSGYALDDASILTTRPGSAFIGKPFTVTELSERVAGLLREARQATASSPRKS